MASDVPPNSSPSAASVGVDSLLGDGDVLSAESAYRRQLEDQPNDVRILNQLAITVAAAGRAEEAVELLRTALQHDPRDAQSHHNFGVALAELGRLDEAIASFASALNCANGYVEAHHNLARALRRQGRLAEAESEYRVTLDLAPDRETALYDLATLLTQLQRPEEAVELLERALRQRPGWNDALAALGAAQLTTGRLSDATDGSIGKSQRARQLPKIETRPCEQLAADQKVLTVLVGCYGNYPQYSLRCLDSIAGCEELCSHCNFFIGLNECCDSTVSRARELVDAGIADAVVHSRRNLNKDPMWRVLLEMVQTPYMMWLDDDSYFVDPAWASAFAGFVRDEHPFDVAGQARVYGPDRMGDPDYATYIRARPWWRGDEHYEPELREWIPFVLGGAFIARTSFLREHTFPDRGMTKWIDDVALGELVAQVKARQIAFPTELLGILGNAGIRRGTGRSFREGVEAAECSE